MPQFARPQFNFAPPTGIAESIMGAFYNARQSVFQEADMQRRAMQEDKDRHYLETVVRPMQEEQAKMGLLNQQLNLKSTKLRLSQARMAQEQQLSQVQMQDAAISAVDSISQRVGAHLMGEAPAGQSPAQGGNLGTFGGVPISTRYEKSKVSWFGGGDDPDDNGLSAWGGSNNTVPGVAIPSKMLKAIYGHDKGANGQFTDGKVRVKARLSDGTEKEMVVPIVDKGTAEWVVQRDGMKLDLNKALAQQLGGEASASKLGGIQNVDFELLDKNGNPIGQPSDPQSGPKDARTLLDDHDEITRLETDPIVANNPIALGRLKNTKAHIERTPEFQTLVQQRQQEQQLAQWNEEVAMDVLTQPMDFTKAFSARYQEQGFGVKYDREGNVTPIDSENKQPLTGLRLVAFHTAWQGFKADVSKNGLPEQITYRPDKETVAALGTFRSLSSPAVKAQIEQLSTDKQVEYAMKLENAMTTLAMAAEQPGGVDWLQRAMPKPEPKAEAETTDAPTAAPTTGDAPAPIPTKAERESAPAKEKLAEQINQQWTEAKSFVQSNLDEVYPSENDKLALAADIMRGERVKSPSKGVNVNMETYLTHDVLKLADKGKSFAQVAFEESGNERTGPQSVRWNEVVKAWAKEYLESKGYDSKGNPKQSAAPAVTNENDKAKLEELGL
jgi:hypothetical protein